jgi:integrase
MPSLTITTRQTASGPRYVVRYRLGGRAYPIVHAGAFRTLKDAKARRDLVGGEIAAGRNPRDLLEQLVAAAPARTFATAVAEYERSRVDAADATRGKIVSHLRTFVELHGAKDPNRITRQDVQAWISGLGLKPSSVKAYIATLRLVLDFVGVDPNPARDQHLRLPRGEREIPQPPSGREVAAIIAAAPERRRLLLEVLAGTGMRVGEVCDLEWQDVDLAGSRFRIRHGKTTAARRWVPVSADLIAAVDATLPEDDRTATRRVFQGATVRGVGGMMRRACQSAGVAHYHPHDLRHRWISLQVKRGVPITEISAHVGHSRSSLTLDTYSHVMLDD